ncbi:hypothetical protein [Acuticoccus sediminis]|uniref:hypothetical protein n=1 Tax=Acuticoccus sediminis TaxID=2184697 RepID=UPI0011B94382|nr:hypothetical protein [Acuticoccus sediminis]
MNLDHGSANEKQASRFVRAQTRCETADRSGIPGDRPRARRIGATSYAFSTDRPASPAHARQICTGAIKHRHTLPQSNFSEILAMFCGNFWHPAMGPRGLRRPRRLTVPSTMTMAERR